MAFFTLWIALPLAVLLQRSVVQQQKGAQDKTRTMRVHDESEAMKGMRRGVLDGIGIGPDSSAYMSGKMDVTIPGDDGDVDKLSSWSSQKANSREIIERYSEYVVSIFPPLYASTRPSAWRKLWKELQINHVYGQILTDRSHSKAVVRLTQVLCTITSTLFLIALLFDLQYPNNGADCGKKYTNDDCINAYPATALDTETSSTSLRASSTYGQYCWWDEEYFECHDTDLVVPAQTYFILTIWFSILALPVHLLMDFVFTCILLAPTAVEIDNHDRRSFYESAIKLAETAKRRGKRDKSAVHHEGSDFDHTSHGMIQSLLSRAKAHLKAGKSHLSARHSKGEAKRLKMLEKSDRREKMLKRDDLFDDDKSQAAMSPPPLADALSRAVLPASDTVKLQSNAERAILSSLHAQSQLYFVRKHYLPSEHLNYMRYVEEKSQIRMRLGDECNTMEVSAVVTTVPLQRLLGVTARRVRMNIQQPLRSYMAIKREVLTLIWSTCAVPSLWAMERTYL